MQGKNNTRYVRANERIQEAFFELIKEKGFEAITATEIIRRSGVNRTTFYSHYKDKYDLLSEVEDNFFEGMMSAIANVYDSNNTESSNYSAVFHIAIHYYYENRNFVSLLVRDGNRQHLLTVLNEKASILWKKLGLKIRLPIPENYVRTALLSMGSSLLVTWAGNGFDIPPDEFERIFVTLAGSLPRDIFQLEQ